MSSDKKIMKLEVAKFHNTESREAEASPKD